MPGARPFSYKAIAEKIAELEDYIESPLFNVDVAREKRGAIALRLDVRKCKQTDQRIAIDSKRAHHSMHELDDLRLLVERAEKAVNATSVMREHIKPADQLDA